MGIRVALYHKTQYDYDQRVTVGPQLVRLRPAPHCRTRILSYSLNVSPPTQYINWQQDPQSNYVARLVFPGTVERLLVEVDLVAELAVINPFDFFLEPYAEQFPFEYDPQEQRDLRPYLETLQGEPDLTAYVDSISREPKKSVNFLVDLNQRIQSEIRYRVRMEEGVQAPGETLARRSGSCRDSAWLLVQVLRRLGLAARFVSGYLIQLKPDVEAVDGPSGASEDFTDLHAWAEVYLPGAGWVGLDPTSGLFAGEGHIPLAATPEPQTASPVTGRVSPCEVSFHHEMRVTRLPGTPRVTKPYSDEQWEAILAAGDRVDRQLADANVRLTTSSKIAFVSTNDSESPEWNHEGQKEPLAAELLRRLGSELARGGVPHFGQGSILHGDSDRPWPDSYIWRADGQALWQAPEFIGDPEKDYRFGPAEARRFAESRQVTEARGGRLFVFLPPASGARDYVESVAAVEATAANLSLPVFLEGSLPPPDPLFRILTIFPESGVITVQTESSATWRELVSGTTILYQQARLTHLGAERFTPGGKHTGAGRNPQLRLGGPTVADSPFVRRPDLLQSLRGFWLNHPSLPFLFSSGSAGNAMVAESTSPSNAASQPMGSVEIRGFEPPPGARMYLTHQLLIRALIAWFWREPYKAEPVRWDTRLYDIYRLPCYIHRDFEWVIDECNRAEYPLDKAWFNPQFEFRFPVHGRVVYDGVEIELRQAIETPGETAGSVDEVWDRLQVRARGLVLERRIVTCNGRRLPLQPTGLEGEYVCGVRYQASPAHTPLVFDLLELSAGRSVAGCRYHSGHPGGHKYESPAINSNEAESRRMSRFEPFGHTPGRMAIPPQESNPEAPATLDLGRPISAQNNGPTIGEG